MIVTCHQKLKFYFIAYSVKRWRIGLFFLFLLIVNHSNAQIKSTTIVPVAPEVFANSYIRCFFKDSRGYMWIGTGDGLFRYDGTNAYRYEHVPEDSTSISHNIVNAVVEDSHQNLWIGTVYGIVQYNLESDVFKRVDPTIENSKFLNEHYITSIAIDQKGKLWIGTHGHGVYVYDPIKNTIDVFVDGDRSASSAYRSNFINALYFDGSSVWAGTKKGLKRFDTSAVKSTPINFLDSLLQGKQITQVVSDTVRNTIWITTFDGDIVKINEQRNHYTFQKFNSGKHDVGATLLSLSLDGEGNLWYGGEHAGLNYLHAASKEVTKFPVDDKDINKLPTNAVRVAYVDDDGLIWVGTYSKGAYIINNRSKKFENYNRDYFSENALTGKGVRSFEEDADHNIWIAFDDVGLVKLDAKTRTLQRNAISDKLPRQLNALFYDRDENLWIGSNGQAVYRVNLKSNQIKQYAVQSNGLGDNRVSCIYQDKKGTIWVGSLGSGLFYFDKQQNRFVLLDDEHKKKNSISATSYINWMMEDSHNNFWIATMYGLFSLRDAGDYDFTYTRYALENGNLISNAVQVVHEDANGNFWIGTTDNGLVVRYKNDSTFKSFRKKDGLASNSIRSIVEDRSGNLWLSGNYGLTKFDPTSNTFITYSKNDGLLSDNFHANAGLITHSGELFLGNNNGFNAFYPDSIQSRKGVPKVYLSALKINSKTMRVGAADSPLSKHISVTSRVELTYDQRSFTIDFVALNYGQSYRNQYSYKLVGFDEDWNFIGGNTSATYTNLDPGVYEFLVRATDEGGGWSEQPTVLTIKIQAQWWATRFAMFCFFIAILSITIALIRFRTNRIKMKNQLALERDARIKEHELSESKAQFFTNISHELRTPLSLILMPLESVCSTSKISDVDKGKLEVAYKNASKMMYLVNELLEFNTLDEGKLILKLEQVELVGLIREFASAFSDIAAHKEINFQFKPTVESLLAKVDTHKLEKIVDNLLSNAFKFTPPHGSITVQLEHIIVHNNGNDNPYFILVVSDTGLGIAEDELGRVFDKFYQTRSASRIANPGTGIGLSFVKGLVELHQGTIGVRSKVGVGTTFTVRIPLIQPNNADGVEIPLEENGIESFLTDQQTEFNFTANQHEVSDKEIVLLVEDNDALRQYLAIELRKAFTVLEARDGVEGLIFAQNRIPDLIISDVLMPGKSGVELCTELKSEIKTSHIPFILLTAKVSEDDKILGIEAGADIYITKPFSIRFLVATVKNVISSRQKLYAHFSQDVYLMPSKVTSNEMDQEFLEKAMDFIVDHIQDTQLGVDSIASLFNLSRTQVYRKIKALTGRSVVEFIRMVRLKQALKLMETQKYTLSEIAFKTGFNSPSYFTRSFKDEYGKAPSEYLEGIS
jgi:signal transduction histidine kinase/ligand-binding sensor domain-containing protein/AraC-like DNA-binding protein